MSHPIFKPLADQLSLQEESEITKDLANAYRKHEIGEQQPTFKRIIKKIEERIREQGPG